MLSSILRFILLEENKRGSLNTLLKTCAPLKKTDKDNQSKDIRKYLITEQVQSSQVGERLFLFFYYSVKCCCSRLFCTNIAHAFTNKKKRRGRTEHPNTNVSTTLRLPNYGLTTSCNGSKTTLESANERTFEYLYLL